MRRWQVRVGGRLRFVGGRVLYRNRLDCCGWMMGWKVNVVVVMMCPPGGGRKGYVGMFAV
jgi:hypothetical protein